MRNQVNTANAVAGWQSGWTRDWLDHESHGLERRVSCILILQYRYYQVVVSSSIVIDGKFSGKAHCGSLLQFPR